MIKAKVARTGLIVALGVATVLGALVLAMPLGRPAAWDFDHPRLATVTETRAVAATETAPPDLKSAESQTLLTLEERPLDATAWARLAWIADQRGDEPAMLEALDRSYVAAPYGPDITAWRLQFALDRWRQLTPQLRRQAHSELIAVRESRPGLFVDLEQRVSDPAGRMAFALTKHERSKG